MPGTLTGKVALVTGGASGIGRATALTFAREGAKLVIADMNEEGGQQTVHMITENGDEVKFVRVDVSNATEVEAMISKAVETYGRLDCAHNNAGVTQRAYPPTGEFSEDDWHRVLAINLTGVWLCMKYEIPQMLKQGGGAIVNTASVAGLVGLAGRSAGDTRRDCRNSRLALLGCYFLCHRTHNDGGWRVCGTIDTINPSPPESPVGDLHGSKGKSCGR